MIKEMRKDLMTVCYGIIAHQVNCNGRMHGVLANRIQKRLTEQQLDDYKTICHRKGEALLGFCTMYPVKKSQMLYVANLFSVGRIDPSGDVSQYEPLRKALTLLKTTASILQLPVSIPGYLGCGLAHGDWEYVYRNIIIPIFEGSPVELNICYSDANVSRLWEDFGDVPMDPETEMIDEPWHGFIKGVYRENIWLWFEKSFDVRVYDLMYDQEEVDKNDEKEREDPGDEDLASNDELDKSSEEKAPETLQTPQQAPHAPVKANTRICYIYRDAANHKKCTEGVIEGNLTKADKNEIWDCLAGEISDHYFLPEQVGLSSDNCYYGTEDDTPWFELLSIEDTDDAVTCQNMTAAELYRNFLRAKDRWDPERYS